MTILSTSLSVSARLSSCRQVLPPVTDRAAPAGPPRWRAAYADEIADHVPASISAVISRNVLASTSLRELYET